MHVEKYIIIHAIIMRSFTVYDVVKLCNKIANIDIIKDASKGIFMLLIIVEILNLYLNQKD